MYGIHLSDFLVLTEGVLYRRPLATDRVVPWSEIEGATLYTPLPLRLPAILFESALELHLTTGERLRLWGAGESFDHAVADIMGRVPQGKRWELGWLRIPRRVPYGAARPGDQLGLAWLATRPGCCQRRWARWLLMCGADAVFALAGLSLALCLASLAACFWRAAKTPERLDAFLGWPPGWVANSVLSVLPGVALSVLDVFYRRMSSLGERLSLLTGLLLTVFLCVPYYGLSLRPRLRRALFRESTPREPEPGRGGVES